MEKASTPPAHDVEELGKVIRVSVKSIRPFPGQPRTFFDQAKLRELSASINAVGQQIPGLVKEVDDDPNYRYELVDGQRRWHALQMAGIPKMKVIVTDIKDVEEQFTISVVSNFGRAEHGPMEIARAIVRFKKNGKSAKEIAEIFGRSEGWVYQHLKLAEKLDPKVQDMMSQEIAEEDRLVMAVALMIADVPDKALQRKLADTIVSKKLKMVQAKDHIKRTARQKGIPVGNPERTPNRDYNIVENFLCKLERELRVFMDWPPMFLERMFEHRPETDHPRTIQKVEQNITSLQIFLGMLKRAKKQSA